MIDSCDGWLAGWLWSALGQRVRPGDRCGSGQAPVGSARLRRRRLRAGGTIKGTVKAGAVPLPGVGITATNTLTGKKYATTTDVTGAFAMAIPRNGRYVVKAELAAFATETKEVLINAAGQNGGKADQVVEFGLQLASRVAQQQQNRERQERRRAVWPGLWGVGMQSLSVTGDDGRGRCKR